MRNNYTLLVNTDHNLGVLNRITTLITRLQLNIINISISLMEENEIYKCLFVINTPYNQVHKAINKIEKIIGVYCAYVCEESDQIVENTILIKLKNTPSNKEIIENKVRLHNAKVVCIQPSYIIIEKTGSVREMTSLQNSLKPFEITESIKNIKNN